MKLKQKLLVWFLAFTTVIVCPVLAFASSDDDTVDKIYDARLEGYDNKNVTLDSSSTALLWILLIIMAALCVGVMFKNAKRTHLD